MPILDAGYEMTDDRTPHLDLPLPSPDNMLVDDVPRLREALTAIDTKFGLLDALLGSDDATLDAVQELVNAIKANITSIASLTSGKADASTVSTLSSTVTSHVGSGGTAHAAATDSVAGFMSAADKAKLDGVSLGVLFEDIEITPTAGQTSFAVSGGYTAGCIQVFVNGLRMKSGDFTATDGSNVVLASGLTESDELVIVRFKRGLAA